MIDPLSELAIQHGTDKFGLHDYTPNYHHLFAGFRDRRIRLLEIGVGGYADEDRGGQSLATWRDYFPFGEITGIDIQKKSLPLGDRVRILQGSQIDVEFLADVVEGRGPFDLIVDDGSHRNEHVVESFRLLWPTLARGGVYVVEDVQTAFMPRFGGSLDLVAPNSVGRFADLLPEVGGDVARITRFHNMIAIDKAGGEARATAHEPMATVRADAGEAAIRTAWDRLPVPGLLRVEGRLEDDVAGLLRHLFAQVDHREISHNFPSAPIDPMAALLQRLEVDATGATLRKAPNDYPSNFAFDPRQPEAAAALLAMAEVLETSDREEGLVHYASLLTTLHGREVAAPWLCRLEEIGATSRIFHQLAGGLAQRERRSEDARRHYEAGSGLYPDDSILAQGLVSAHLVLGDVADAHAALVAALTRMPRDASLHLQMVRVAERLGDMDLAIEHARVAIGLSNGARRAPALVTLGEALARAGRSDEAESALVEAAKAPGRHAAKAWRGLSGVRATLGRMADAVEAAERAVELRPDERSYREWADRLLRAAATASPAACPAEEERATLAA